MKKLHTNMTDYYTVLGCSRNASYEDLKKSYQELARIHHPDKGKKSSLDQFYLIDEAWKTLRDPTKKEAYDLRLKQEMYNNPPIYAVVTFSDLDVDKATRTYSYPCRCGGTYNFETDISEECIISCDECSFSLHVKDK